MSKAVSAIRKALNDPPNCPRFIETRRAAGYRYIGPLVAEPANGAAIAEVERIRGVKVVIRDELQADTAAEESVSALPSPAQSQSLTKRLSARRTAGLAVVCGVIALAGVALASFLRRAENEKGRSAPMRSIAVLPLKNLTGDPAQDYFGDGVTESLINELAKVRALKVIARNSSFAFKGKEVDVREIGRRLGVAAVLEGSLRRDTETVRVTVRLVSTEDGRVLWTGDTTRPLKEIIAVQDEIGCSVAESLQAVLCRDPNHKPGTSDLAAYEVYLKARDRRLKGDPGKAAELCEQAVNADPNYALAWAGLAEAYAVMEVNSIAPPRSLTGRARECALKALALDGSLASPHAVLGLLAALATGIGRQANGISGRRSPAIPITPSRTPGTRTRCSRNGSLPRPKPNICARGNSTRSIPAFSTIWRRRITTGGNLTAVWRKRRKPWNWSRAMNGRRSIKRNAFPCKAGTTKLYRPRKRPVS